MGQPMGRIFTACPGRGPAVTMDGRHGLPGADDRHRPPAGRCGPRYLRLHPARPGTLPDRAELVHRQARLDTTGGNAPPGPRDHVLGRSNLAYLHRPWRWGDRPITGLLAELRGHYR